jgi:tRNA A37 threonylcarbamoyladenosine synthetase subunit TsaC/SUA5/YrdC
MIPALFKNKKRTVGIRVPDDAILKALIDGLGHALAATSVHSDDDIRGHFSDPAEIEKEKGHLVAAVIDGGNRGLDGSTVIDLTGEEPIVLREGIGSLDIL